MNKRRSLIWICVISVSGLLTIANSALPSTNGYQSKLSVRHIVLIDFNEQVPDSVLVSIEIDLDQLEEKISQIKELEWGVNMQADSDYSHCLMMIFENVEDLEEYEEHPAHLEFASTYGPHVAKMTQVDYWR